MRINQLATPSFLVDLDILEKNIQRAVRVCQKNKVELWPMTKAHKSTGIARKQYQAGAQGFLAGTLQEAQSLLEEGYKDIMLAYPVAGKANIAKLVNMRRRANIIASLDGLKAARALNEALEQANLKMEYLVIVDCGLHRFGVELDGLIDLVSALRDYDNLKFKGISSHPGQVYGVSSLEGVKKVAQEELSTLRQAKTKLLGAGFKVDVVASGSTPTFEIVAQGGVITVLRPGNYVFYDNIQRSMGVITEEDCALSVLATVISKPNPQTMIIDAGSKCFGLDKGAHGASNIEGFGYIKGHEELLLSSLSEEVGKITIKGESTVSVGDQLEIIPNHACTTASMTSYLIGHRQGNLEKNIEIDIRGGSERIKW